MFDVAEVVDRAGKALLAANNMPTEARQIYEAAILEWTDAYNDSLQGSASPEALHAKRAIAQLWMEYARMERTLRQWKQAVTVFENALADETVNDLVDVWIEYANFYDKERQKPAKAQKVYIRALGTVPAHERPRIWDAFLQSMRQQTPDLTLEQLKLAVQSQYQEPPEEAVAAGAATATQAAAVPTIKRELPTSQTLTETPPAKRPHAETAGADGGYAAQRQMLSPAERQTRILQFLDAYREKPPTLFTPLSGDIPRLQDLDTADRAALEELFMCDRETQALSFPPKQTIFEVVEALSMVQALKERTFDKWFSDLQERQHARGRAMHMDHQEREAMAPETHRSEIRRLNKEEYDKYVSDCELEVKTLHALVRKEALGILRLQQQILAELGLPRMTITSDPVLVAKQREIVQALQLAHGEDKNEPVLTTAPPVAAAAPAAAAAMKVAPRQQAPAAVPKRAPAPTMRTATAASAAGGSGAARSNGHTTDPRQMMRHPTAQQAREVMAAVAAASGGGTERTEDGGAGQVNPEALPMLMKIAAILQQAKK